MAKARALPRPANRRGSPEAVEKRRVARMFNDLLGDSGTGSKLDGRTAKRRQRLLRELEQNMANGQRELKPLDVLQRVQELLELGEPLSSIRKVRKLPRPLPTTRATVELIQRLQEAYQFRLETYRFVGVSDEVLTAAGVIPREGRRSPRRSGGRGTRNAHA